MLLPKIWLTIACIAIAVLSLKASEADTAFKYRKELKGLLEERHQKFDSYSQSLEQRSGIFGNKTKRDIKESNKVLIEIVKTDNRIISTLNRVLDYRNYEKINLNYSMSDTKLHREKLLQATDTLEKQVKMLSSTNAVLKKSNHKLQFGLYFLLAVLLVFILYIYFKKR